MCIALRPDKASEANTRKSEYLARIKGIEKIFLECNYNFRELLSSLQLSFCYQITRIRTRFKALGLNKQRIVVFRQLLPDPHLIGSPSFNLLFLGYSALVLVDCFRQHFVSQSILCSIAFSC